MLVSSLAHVGSLVFAPAARADRSGLRQQARACPSTLARRHRDRDGHRDSQPAGVPVRVPVKRDRGRPAGTTGRPVASSWPAARCGGTGHAGAGSERAAAARRWPSRPGARLRCGSPGPRGRGTSGRSRRSGSPTSPRAGRVVESEQGVRLGEADLQAENADQHREQALDLAEGPGEGPAEGTVRPHSAPPRSSNWRSSNDSTCRDGRSRAAPTPSQAGLLAATDPIATSGVTEQTDQSSSAGCREAAEPSGRPGDCGGGWRTEPSAELLGKHDDDPLPAADRAKPVTVLVAPHPTSKLRPAGLQTGDGGVEVIDHKGDTADPEAEVRTTRGLPGSGATKRPERQVAQPATGGRG